MKKMNLKSIFNWFYVTIIDRAMSVKRERRTAECPVDSQGVSAPREFAERIKNSLKPRRPREDRGMHASVYRLVSVPYAARISLMSLFLLVLGGLNSEVWGKQTTKATVTIKSGKGTVSLKAQYKPNVWSTEDGATGSISTISEASNIGKEYFVSYDRGNTQDGSVVFEATAGTGYTFYGWCTKPDCSDDSPNSSNPLTVSKGSWKTIDETRYTKFTPNSYDVTLNPDGGSGSNQTVTATYDSGMPTTLKGGGAIVAPTKAGYTFAGYFDAASGGTKYYNANLTSAHTWNKASTGVTLYAHWTANTYTITLTAGAGTTSAGTTSITATYDASTNLTSAITTPTKDKNVFDGYYTGTNGSGTQIIDAFGNIIANAGGGSTYTDANKKWKYAGNIELYAKWISKYDFEITGGNYTINNEAWSKTGAFTFVHADEAHMTTTIQKPDVISYDRASNTITALKIGTSKITFTQNTSTTVNNGTIEWTITVDSVANNLTVSGTSFKKYVEQEVTSVRSNQNSDGTITTTSSNPNLAHYDIANNKIVIPNSDAQKLPFDDVVITISQAATAKYKAKKHTITLKVEKYANTIKVKGSTSYSSSIYVDSYDNGLTLTADNTDYTNCPITNTQTAGSDVATFYQNDEVVYSSYKLGTATWNLSQSENYKYQEGSGSFTVTVAKAAEATDCYVKTDINSEHKFSSSWETKWNDENAADTLRFEACAQAAWTYGMNVYQLIDGNWSLIEYIDHDHMHMAYTNYSYSLDQRAKGVKFEQTGTLSRWVKNVYVTRATYIEASNVTIDKTSSNNPVYPSEGTGVGTLTINYSIANGGDLKISNDNPKFTLSQDTISDVDCTTGTADINIQYNSAVAGEDVAHLVIYNDVYRKEVTVTGVCVKHDQSGEWKENIGTLKLGTVLKNPYSSTRSASNGVTYEFVEGDEDVITIVGTTLTAAKVGTATIQATVPSDDTYNSITSTIEIAVTDDYVQYIVWDQDCALRHLKTTDDTFTLNASASSDVVECTTNGSRTVTYEVIDDDDAAGTAVTVEGNVLTIVRAGKAKVRASVARGEDADGHTYAAAQAVKDVIVRDPSALCEELYLYTLTGSGESTTGTNDIGTDKDAKYQRGSKTFTTGVFEYSPAYVTLFAKNRDDGSGLGTITVEQNVPSSGWISAGVVENPSATSWPDEPDMFPLRSDATQVRVVINQTKNYIYCGNIKVVMASFAKVKESSVEKEVLEFSSYIGTPQAKNVQVQWYSRRDLYLELPEGAPFTLSTDVFEKECEVANTDLRITFNTLVSQTNRDYELLITDRQDGGFRKTVVLRATATAETVTFSGEGNWTDDKWEGTPSKYVEATISKNADVTISTEVEVHSLSIASGASVTITPTGGLKVGSGGISSLSEKKIKLESNSSGQTGYIRISPDYEGEMPEADIELFSKAYYATGDAKMQYIGVSVDEENYAAKSVLSSTTYLYNWDESAGKWVNRRKTVNFTPFVGYATTQKGDEGGQNINYSGKLVSIEDQEIDLSYTESSPFAGRNLLANSYAAPIDISKFELRDFSLEDEYDTSVDYAIYLYNTGSKSDYKDTSGDPASLTAAGQYITVTPGTASALHGVDDDYPVVIPSMQGFFVKANAPGKTLKLNYKRLIYDANYATHGNTPLRVRSNKVAQENESDEDAISGAMKITLFTETDVDHLYLLESENYNKGYENGYDGRKMLSGDLNIYAIEGDEALSVDATDDIEGTKLGIRTGSSDEYTISFSRVQTDKNLYLRDTYTGKNVLRIEEGAQYTFYASPDSYLDGRFMIVGIGEQGVSTGVDANNAEEKATKYIKDDTMYILKNGLKYNSLGQRVQ